MGKSIMEYLSVFLLCGFLAVFIVPEIIISLFYRVPIQISRYSQGRASGKSITRLLFDILVWLLALGTVYAVLFLVDPTVGLEATESPVAIGCWVLGAGVTVFRLVRTVQEDNRARKIRRIESVHKLPLGKILLMSGVITENQLNDALSLQRKRKEPIGEVLLGSEILSTRVLDEYLAKQREMIESGKEIQKEELRIGEILMQAEIITRTQLKVALDYQKRNGGLIGDCLLATRCITEDMLGIILDIQTILDYAQISPRQAGHLITGIMGSSYKNVGTILMKSGLISRSQLDLALRGQQEYRRQVGDILVDLDFVPRPVMDAVLRIQELGRKDPDLNAADAADDQDLRRAQAPPATRPKTI